MPWLDEFKIYDYDPEAIAEGLGDDVEDRPTYNANSPDIDDLFNRCHAKGTLDLAGEVNEFSGADDGQVTFDLPDFDAVAAEYDAANAPKSPGGVELCRCGAAASYKVVEEIDDRLELMMHPLSVYLCERCFIKLMGPAVMIPRPEMDPDCNPPKPSNSGELAQLSGIAGMLEEASTDPGSEECEKFHK